MSQISKDFGFLEPTSLGLHERHAHRRTFFPSLPDTGVQLGIFLDRTEVNVKRSPDVNYNIRGENKVAVSQLSPLTCSNNGIFPFDLEQFQ